jgi:hypothetical protein
MILLGSGDKMKARKTIKCNEWRRYLEMTYPVVQQHGKVYRRCKQKA